MGCCGLNCPESKSLIKRGRGDTAPTQMAEQQVIERTEDGTVIRTGADGQRLKIPQMLPILPIRNIVVFPGTVMPLNIGRAKSKSLLEEVMPGDKLIGVI